MRTIVDAEKEYGKRWREWTQSEWDAVLKTVEEDDLKTPLIVNKVMEAFTNGRFSVLTVSVLAFIGKTLAMSELEKMMEGEDGRERK